MKSSLTLTIPDKIKDALQALAEKRGYGEDVPELIKGGLMLAMESPEGWKLKLEPVARAPDPNQAELPLLVQPGAED
jgi:hypothetical protein